MKRYGRYGWRRCARVALLVVSAGTVVGAPSVARAGAAPTALHSSARALRMAGRAEPNGSALHMAGRAEPNGSALHMAGRVGMAGQTLPAGLMPALRRTLAHRTAHTMPWRRDAVPLLPGGPWRQRAELTSPDTSGYIDGGVAVSGNTAVVGVSDVESSAGAAYVFVHAGSAWRQQAELRPSGAPDDCFGGAVAVSGDTIVVGGSCQNSSFGVAYVFARDGSTWTQQAELTNPQGSGDVAFGNSVSVSGATVVVGTLTGAAAYVYVRSANTWLLQATLTPADGSTGLDYYDDAVAVSGDTVVVGAYAANNYTGVAYVFVRSGTTWSRQATLTAADGAAFDQFGVSVAVSGDTAIVGAIGGNNVTGAAYIFVRSGATWSQQAELTTPNGAMDDEFGTSVALNGATAAVGAYGANGVAGAAYVFVRRGSAWTLQGSLAASDSASEEFFGETVALSGDTLVVEADAQSGQSGIAYVFSRSAATTWSRQDGLSARGDAPGNDVGYSVAAGDGTILVGAPGMYGGSGAAYVATGDGAWTTLAAAGGAPGDVFGYAVAAAGDTIAVGAPGTGSARGTVYVFARNGTAWHPQAGLTPLHGAPGDRFGSSVALSGDTLAVGAPAQNQHAGAVYVFVRRENTWRAQATLAITGTSPGSQFGWAVALGGDTLVATAPGRDHQAGAAYVFVRIGATWRRQAALTASDAAPFDRFGTSAALSGDTVVVGSPNRDHQAGAAYIFARNGPAWQPQAMLLAAQGTPADQFGSSLALSGDTVIVGAPGRDHFTGAAVVYVHSGGTWRRQAFLAGGQDGRYDNLGAAVAVSGDTALVGAYGANGSRGAAYLFARD